MRQLFSQDLIRGPRNVILRQLNPDHPQALLSLFNRPFSPLETR